jgi:hypothetical protein
MTSRSSVLPHLENLRFPAVLGRQLGWREAVHDENITAVPLGLVFKLTAQFK